MFYCWEMSVFPKHSLNYAYEILIGKSKRWKLVGKIKISGVFIVISSSVNCFKMFISHNEIQFLETLSLSVRKKR